MPTATASAASMRKVASLALPALAVLAAEPLYVLVDTAVVGHLGSVPLAALAVGGIVLTVAEWFGTVLAYGTTGRAARHFGAGSRSAAVAEGVQASWLALTLGVVILVTAQVFADPVASALSGRPAVAHEAAGWLRVAALGAPGLLLALAGNGWLRGVQDTRRPLRYVVGANLLSAALCPILVYPCHLGLRGSAVANATAQTLSGALFVRALIRERQPLRPHLALLRSQLVVGRDLLVRGLAFQACFLSATAVTARFGTVVLGAHQIALQLWMFCSLIMDAVAIAAQSLVGAALGAGDPVQARSLARRIALVGLASGVLLGALIFAGMTLLPGLFTADPAVHRQAMIAWPWFVAMQPLGGVLFALDGVLMGAGDVAFLRNVTILAALAGFLPLTWLAYAFQLGLGGVWAGLTAFIVIRLIAALIRLRTDRWAIVGATR